MIILDQFGTIQILKPVTGQEIFFAVSYSKPALENHFQTLGKNLHDSNK